MIEKKDFTINVMHTRELREKLLSDMYRPRYHFATIEDLGIPGDPNGAFYAKGIYHLMYLYNRSGEGFWNDANFCWGHISSVDLVHWRHHPDAIIPSDGDGGCFSGGAFLDDDGTAYISYWSLPLKGECFKGSGIGIAKSSDKYYEKWEKITPTAIAGTDFGILKTLDANGDKLFLGNADPSNIWKSNGYYYLQAGNKCVLDTYGRDEDSLDKYKGDWVDLFRSKDMKKWEYVHRFYDRDATNKWTDETEDDMCPSFLPLPTQKQGGEKSKKHLQLFISHNKGCQYYIGGYDEDKQVFTPQSHGRMSWNDNTFFAPEALIDGDGRQIMWSWLLDNPKSGEDELSDDGWSGVYGLPRCLWLGENDTLNMAPVDELKMLRMQMESYTPCEIDNTVSEKALDIEGLSHEIELVITLGSAKRAGIRINTSVETDEYTDIYYDASKGKLVFDARSSGKQGCPIIEEAPFVLCENEKLKLRIFIDRSVIEVFANNRQAITRRVFPEKVSGENATVFATDGNANFEKITVWEMAASNPY